MVLKLYFDLMSQPSRALTIFFRVAKIPYEPVPIAIRKGEHKQPEFLKINQFGRVPCIEDNGLKLSESVAIARYVARQYLVDDCWYPKDSIAQARVDEFLEWHHIDLRSPCAHYFRLKILYPRLAGKEPKPDDVKTSYRAMETALDNVEKNWLGDGRPYIIGDKISIADIFAACEIEQPRMAGFDPLDGRPRLTMWLERVRSELNPHYKDAHFYLNKFVENTIPSKL